MVSWGNTMVGLHPARQCGDEPAGEGESHGCHQRPRMGKADTRPRGPRSSDVIWSGERGRSAPAAHARSAWSGRGSDARLPCQSSLHPWSLVTSVGSHSLVAQPRQYGKTSTALHASGCQSEGGQQLAAETSANHAERGLDICPPPSVTSPSVSCVKSANNP